jgi:hypothetical protein
LLKDNIPGKEQYWVTLDPELMEPDGEIQELMPEWMQKAKQKGAFDSVELTGKRKNGRSAPERLSGLWGVRNRPVRKSACGQGVVVHLEVLSTDSRMPGFLSNPEKVKGDKSQFWQQRKALFTRQDATGQPVFTDISRLSAQCLLTRGATTPVADESQKWWYKISGVAGYRKVMLKK